MKGTPTPKSTGHIIVEWIWRFIQTGLMLVMIAKLFDVGVDVATVVIKMKSDIELHGQRLDQHDKEFVDVKAEIRQSRFR